jgi:hypothetical protein
MIDTDDQFADDWILVDAAPKKAHFDPVLLQEKIRRETESMRSTPS